MSMFSNLKNDGLEESQDRLGGGGHIFETKIYTGTIKNLYGGKSARGSLNATLILDLDGKEYRETFYVTNAKGENWFINKDDPTKKVPLPGFTIVDELCICAGDAPLADQPTEEKVVKIYDFDQKKELPQSVPVFTGLLGKEISVAISKVLENKSKKNDTTGEYEYLPEERTVNQIEKVFHTASKMTFPEARDGKTEPEFWNAWTERNEGKIRDRRKVKDGQAGAGSAPKSSRAAAAPPQASGQAGAPRKSLFGAK